MNKKLNVLLLDISERITYIIELLLLSNKNVGNVSIAHNINWAEDILDKQKADVIILNIKFSDNDGLKFFKRIKELFPKTNTVLLTNYTDDFHKSYATELGADYFIDKSMAYHELPEILTEINATATQH